MRMNSTDGKEPGQGERGRGGGRHNRRKKALLKGLAGMVGN